MEHHKWLIAGIVILTLPILLVGCVSKSEYETLESSYNTLQEEYITLQEEYTALRANYASLLKDKISIVEEVENLQEQLEELEDSLSLYKETGIKVYEGIPSDTKIIKSLILMEYVELRDNSSAHNPTWEELMSFLKRDRTDAQFYGVNLCGWFAESVHNNAEAARIKAAIVLVNFEEGEGHALNAFNVVDRGLVFVDCTGEWLKPIPMYNPFMITYTIGDTGSNDTIAYVKKGCPIGNINTNMPYGLEYSEYERWQSDVEKMKARFDKTDANYELGEIVRESDSRLGSFFGPSEELVKSIEIYW